MPSNVKCIFVYERDSFPNCVVVVVVAVLFIYAIHEKWILRNRKNQILFFRVLRMKNATKTVSRFFDNWFHRSISCQSSKRQLSKKKKMNIAISRCLSLSLTHSQRLGSLYAYTEYQRNVLRNVKRTNERTRNRTMQTKEINNNNSNNNIENWRKQHTHIRTHCTIIH